MNDLALIRNEAPQAPALRQADNDHQLISLWLHGKAPATIEAYSLEVRRFMAYTGKPLAQATLGDLQAFMDSLAHLSLPAQARAVRVVKSLLSFAHKLGYTAFNVGLAVKAPKVKDTLAERIMTESQVQAMLALEPTPRNKALLLVLYYGGLRCSEVCGLRWRDLQPRQDGTGQATVLGKGSKTRTVLLPATAWLPLQQLRNGTGPDAPVFRSRQGGHLDQTMVLRIVRAAASRAGIQGNVSPHWLRHCHASHALDRGCPIHVLKDSLGHASLATTSRYTHARPGDGAGMYLPA